MLTQARKIQTRGLERSYALPEFFYRVEAGIAEARSNGIELLFIGMSSFCRPRSCASTVEHRVHALVSSAVRMRASALVFLVVTHG